MLEKLIRISDLHFGHIQWPNGMVLSVQAGLFHYCHPRLWFEKATAYSSLEMCIPEDQDYAPLSPYIEETDSICAYVPCEIVEGYIAYLTEKYGPPVALSRLAG